MNRRTLIKSSAALAFTPALLAETLNPPADITPDTVYELRIYHLNPGKLPLILDRFRTRETKIFKRLGMTPIAYWTPIDGDLSTDTLVYIVRHKSREAARATWAAFGKDPEWVALKAETEKDGTSSTSTTSPSSSSLTSRPRSNYFPSVGAACCGIAVASTRRLAHHIRPKLHLRPHQIVRHHPPKHRLALRIQMRAINRTPYRILRPLHPHAPSH